MKQKRSITDSNRYNETKFAILKVIHLSPVFLTPKEIAQKTGLRLHTVESALTRLTKWKYIHRKREYRVHNRNYYCYRHPKEKGVRIFDKLKKRDEIAKVTGMNVSLNLLKPIPPDVRDEYYKKGGKSLDEIDI